MAMHFGSAHVSIPTDLDAETVSIHLHAEEAAEGVVLASLDLTEDQAVEIATMILWGATKLRGARLDLSEGL